MIQANELRKGSCISINGEYKIVDHIKSHDYSVTVDDGFMIVFDGGDYETDETDIIKPIPLTPEILERAGFEKSPTNGFYVNNAMWLEVTPPFTPIYCDGTGFRRYIGKCLKYLHQLQNLYFALTGEELEINLK